MKTNPVALISAVRSALPVISAENPRAVPRSGSALLITLLMLSLITIIAVAFLGTVTWEVSASRNNYENQRARSLALLGMNTAMAQVRQALGPWDNPYKNFATNPPPYFWSMSPGMITCWSYTGTTPLANYALFSVGSTNLVNLNAAIGDGSYPIAGNTNPPTVGAPNISVYWANVLKNPAGSAGVNNQIIGRYAFWVDDENAKINIDTADGTMKYQTNSLGLGSPSEVSLLALQQGGANLSSTVATNIVYLARTTGLNSPKEILRASGTTPDLYTNNVFNLTAYSRSPDLNIFGQPKMALIPMLGQDPILNQTSGDMTTNGITLQAPTEIYPTPSQLPPYTITNCINWALSKQWYPATPPSATKVSWPLAFREGEIHTTIGAWNGFSPGGVNGHYAQTNYPWVNGMMLANYLAGTNAAGTQITWPAFSTTTTGGFVKKYTARQIDSIVAQILDFGAKDISPDYPMWNPSSPVRYQGTRLVVPYVFMGWLSHELVSGVSRGPKLAALELQLRVYGATGSPSPPPASNTQNYHPNAYLSMWEEWWLPAAYLGGLNTIPMGTSAETITQGGPGYQNVLNIADLDVSGGTAGVNQANAGAPLPRANFATLNYWGNQVLNSNLGQGNTNSGIDFQGNPQLRSGTYSPDPDPASAALWHDPFARDPSSTAPPYYYDGDTSLSGSGQDYNTPLAMAQFATNTPWAPGEIRSDPNHQAGQNIKMPMWTNAGVAPYTNLVLGGGIQQHAEFINGAESDPDPVPLESMRGTSVQNPTVGIQTLDGEFWNTPGIPYGSASPTVRDRFLQAVIPVNMTVQVPAPNDPIGSYTANLRIQPADPLVNKFPGDWVSTPVTSLDPWTSPNPPSAPPYLYSSYDEYGSGFHTNLVDPDSFWMPQLDCAQSSAAALPGQTLIPRSARFPSIGYLQYLRTGIIPDDESNASDLLHQHGTPYRLLSFAPLTDPSYPNSQQTTLATSLPYPDWALLDLLYVPSILYPFGGPYGYYNNVSNVWQGYGNPTVMASYSTGGGSTPGRINPNGMVLYTTNTTPTPNISRTVPMQAVLHGLMVNQSLVQQTYTQASTTPNPGYTNASGTPVNDSTLAQAIYNYISANGPLRMPGELCNVPAIYALRPTVNPTGTRNDLIRQIIGNLTTQSNTFSVWVAGQSIAKSKANSVNYGIYEAGDQILATVRYHFIVERYLDPGADGIYGNSTAPGVDGIVGTYDDPVDPINHPFQPRYLYRVVSSEEIR
jgi:Tfp pilus assembly protein PilX